MIDYIILLIGLTFAGIFTFVGVHKIFNFYLGIILGLFIFISLNLDIELLATKNIANINIWQKQILEDKEVYLSWAIIFMPVFGLISSIFTCKSDKSYIIGPIYGLSIPFFIVLILTFIIKNINIQLGFLEILKGYMIDSKIYGFFSGHLGLFWLILLFMMFSKVFYYIGKILWIFLNWSGKGFLNWFLSLKEKKRNLTE